MNITPHNTSIPLATVVNPPTEGLRRENNMREVITPPAAVSQSVAEKGVASEKEKARAPGQTSEEIDFTSIRKQAEAKANTVSGSSEQQGESSSHSEQNSSEQDGTGQDNENNSEQQTQPHSDHSSDNHDNQPSEAEQRVISNLEKRDTEVRAHERAHASVGGGTTGAPSYSFETGPDGKRYATGGEVSVDLSPISGNPQATIAKMQTVKSAALAPVNPSNQDRRVAAAATQTIVKLQSDIATGVDESSSTSSLKQSSASLQDDDKVTNNENETSSDFDAQMKQSLNAQEETTITRPKEIDQRAARIEQHYLKINNAYEQAPSHNFQLTA